MTKKSKFANTVATATLARSVMDKFDALPKKMVKDILSNFLMSIEQSLVEGKKVRIDKIGILAVKDRAGRIGRNPQTGEAIQIAPSKKVRFRVSLTLKDRLGIKKKATTAKTPAVKAKKTTKK